MLMYLFCNTCRSLIDYDQPNNSKDKSGTNLNRTEGAVRRHVKLWDDAHAAVLGV